MLLKNLKAVSYVEIILVLAIVGVISAISIPAMKRHSQKNEFGALAQKAYLTLNEVVDNSILTNGPTRNWGVTTSQEFFAILAPSFNSLSKSTTAVVMKDKMRFSIVNNEKGDFTTIRVDVNGSEFGPQKDGKDIHIFKVFHSNGTVQPDGDTKTLAENGWRFSDELWHK